MATVIRRRAQVVNSSDNDITRVKVRSINNLTRLDASTADWYALNRQIESNSERISNLENKTDSLEDNLTNVSETVNQMSYLLDKDLLTFEEIGA